jgi:hypothetical protein
VAASPERALRAIIRAQDRLLAWEFAVLFARCEYALKRASYLKKLKSIAAEADWERFALAIQPVFNPNANQELQAACSYYFDSTPMRQTVQRGELSWESLKRGDGEHDLVFLCRKITTVRNNLFHGGKFPSHRIEDPSRDTKLLNYAKVILFALVELDPVVRARFMETIEH